MSVIVPAEGTTPEQQEFVRDVIRRCRFDFNLLRSGLQAQTGRTYIPVSWKDLSAWGARSRASGEGDHQHRHEEDEDGNVGHALEHRGRVLGLAWTDGRIELARDLTGLLAEQILLSELAHMVDFFYLTADQRRAIFRAFHGGSDAPHQGHGWWEEAGNADYWSLVGEGFMDAFVVGWSDAPPLRGGFVHETTPAVAAEIVQIVTPAPPTPSPVPPPPPGPQVPPPGPSGPAPFFASARGRTFHDSHRRVPRDVEFGTYAEAVASGRRPCGICRPRPF